jgi:membrane associated rhomboid family serine protease/predicted negative regulator of RcsB-dependent stress response
MPIQRCPQCGNQFGSDFGDSSTSPNCPECEARLAQMSRAGILAPGQTLVAPSFLITTILIGLNALVFVVMVLRGVSPFLPSPQQAIAFGADFGPLTLNGQWWRLITSMFVHFGIVHIGLNMWCLWNLGRAAEQLMGRASYLLAYFVSGIFASIVSVYWHPMAAGAGASGAIFGMAGVLVSYVYLKKTPSHLQINSRMLGSLGTFIAYNLAFGALPGISNAAHIGGLVMGLAVGAALPAAGANENVRRTRLSIVVILSAIALVGSAVAAKKLTRGVSELSSVRHLLAQKKTDEALAQLQQLTAREPEFAPGQELLGKVYLSTGQYPDAIAALQKANAADPGNVTYQKELASVYMQLGMLDDARVFFQHVKEQNPKEAFAHLGLGLVLVAKNQLDSAIAEFQQALALDPKLPGAALTLGQTQLQVGRYADAQATYRGILAQNPDDEHAQAGLEFATRQGH